MEILIFITCDCMTHTYTLLFVCSFNSGVVIEAKVEMVMFPKRFKLKETFLKNSVCKSVNFKLF